MRKNLWALLLFLLIWPLQTTARRYTVIVSLDGFRYDYTQIYDTPFLNWLGHEGVSAVM